MVALWISRIIGFPIDARPTRESGAAPIGTAPPEEVARHQRLASKASMRLGLSAKESAVIDDGL
jgi:hypothetical protein